ncbi:MAG TPA: hypothetical protein ACFYD3_01200 [Candidatus Hypogeohydataceae bacterium YC41]
MLLRGLGRNSGTKSTIFIVALCELLSLFVFTANITCAEKEAGKPEKKAEKKAEKEIKKEPKKETKVESLVKEVMAINDYYQSLPDGAFQVDPSQSKENANNFFQNAIEAIQERSSEAANILSHIAGIVEEEIVDRTAVNELLRRINAVEKTIEEGGWEAESEEEMWE